MNTGQTAVLIAALRVLCKAHPELRPQLGVAFNMRLDIHRDKEAAKALMRMLMAG